MQKHSYNVVYTLQSKLANASKDFKHALEVRSEVLISDIYEYVHLINELNCPRT